MVAKAKIKIELDLSPDYEFAYVADIRKDLQRLINEDVEQIVKDREDKQSAATHHDQQQTTPTTPAENLHAAIENDVPPSDPVTAKAYRFDRAYQVTDRFALLKLYRVLVRTLNLNPVDIRKWIDQDTMLARLDGLQKKRATATDTPADLAASLDWFLQHKYVFGDLGTEEDQAAVDAGIAIAAGERSRLAKLCKEAGDWDKLMREDMDARFEQSEYLAYILTRPHLDHRMFMFYAYANQGPPDFVNTVRMDGNGALKVVRTGQSYADAVTEAEKEYLEAQEDKKKRGVDVAYADQPRNLIGELLALKMGNKVTFHHLQKVAEA